MSFPLLSLSAHCRVRYCLDRAYSLFCHKTEYLTVHQLLSLNFRRGQTRGKQSRIKIIHPNYSTQGFNMNTNLFVVQLFLVGLIQLDCTWHLVPFQIVWDF